jgi:3-methyladenine DNA glycosylase AlkC
MNQIQKELEQVREAREIKNAKALYNKLNDICKDESGLDLDMFIKVVKSYSEEYKSVFDEIREKERLAMENPPEDEDDGDIEGY